MINKQKIDIIWLILIYENQLSNVLLSRERREKVGEHLPLVGPLQGYNKNYESKINSFELYLYRKDRRLL